MIKTSLVPIDCANDWGVVLGLDRTLQRILKKVVEQFEKSQFNEDSKMLFLGIQYDVNLRHLNLMQECKRLFTTNAQDGHITIIFSEDVGFSFINYL